MRLRERPEFARALADSNAPESAVLESSARREHLVPAPRRIELRIEERDDPPHAVLAREERDYRHRDEDDEHSEKVVHRYAGDEEHRQRHDKKEHRGAEVVLKEHDRRE